MLIKWLKDFRFIWEWLLEKIGFASTIATHTEITVLGIDAASSWLKRLVLPWHLNDCRRTWLTFRRNKARLLLSSVLVTGINQACHRNHVSVITFSKKLKLFIATKLMKNLNNLVFALKYSYTFFVVLVWLFEFWSISFLYSFNRESRLLC